MYYVLLHSGNFHVKDISITSMNAWTEFTRTNERIKELRDAEDKLANMRFMRSYDIDSLMEQTKLVHRLEKFAYSEAQAWYAKQS